MSETEPSSIEFEVTVDDDDVDAFWEFQRRVVFRRGRRNKQRTAFLVLAGSVVVFFGGLMIVLLSDATAGVKAAAVMMAVGVLVLRFAPTVMARRSLTGRTSPLNGRYAIDRSGLAHELDGMRWFIPSGGIAGLVVTERHALFHLEDGRSGVIPLRCFRPQRDQPIALEMLASHVAPARR